MSGTVSSMHIYHLLSSSYISKVTGFALEYFDAKILNIQMVRQLCFHCSYEYKITFIILLIALNHALYDAAIHAYSFVCIYLVQLYLPWSCFIIVESLVLL